MEVFARAFSEAYKDANIGYINGQIVGYKGLAPAPEQDNDQALQVHDLRLANLSTVIGTVPVQPSMIISKYENDVDRAFKVVCAEFRNGSENIRLYYFDTFCKGADAAVISQERLNLLEILPFVNPWASEADSPSLALTFAQSRDLNSCI